MTNKISGTQSPGVSDARGPDGDDTKTASEATDETAGKKETAYAEDSWEETPEKDESWSDFLGSAARSISDKAENLAQEAVDEVSEKAGEVIDETGEAIDQISNEAEALVDEVESVASAAVDKVSNDVSAAIDEVEQELVDQYESVKADYKAALAGATFAVEENIRETVADVQNFGEAVAEGRLIDHTVGTAAQGMIEARLEIDKGDGESGFLGAESAEQLEAHFQQMEPGSSETFSLSHGHDIDDIEQLKGAELGLSVDGAVELARPEGSPESYELSYSLQGSAGLSGPQGQQGSYLRNSQVTLAFDSADDAHRAISALRGGATPMMLAEQFPDAFQSQTTDDALGMGIGLSLDIVNLNNPITSLPVAGDFLKDLPVIDVIEDVTSGVGGDTGATWNHGEGSRVVDGELYRTESEDHDVQYNYDAGTLAGLRDIGRAILGDSDEPAESVLRHQGRGISSTTRLTPANAPAGSPPTGMDVSTSEIDVWGNKTVQMVETTEYRNLGTLAKILPNLTTEELATQLESGHGYGGNRDMLVEQITQTNLRHDTDYRITDFLTVTVEVSSIDTSDVDDAAYTRQADKTLELRYTRYGDNSDDFATEAFEEVLTDEFFTESLPQLDQSRLEQQSGRLRDLFEMRLDG